MKRDMDRKKQKQREGISDIICLWTENIVMVHITKINGTSGWSTNLDMILLALQGGKMEEAW